MTNCKTWNVHNPDIQRRQVDFLLIDLFTFLSFLSAEYIKMTILFLILGRLPTYLSHEPNVHYQNFRFTIFTK